MMAEPHALTIRRNWHRPDAARLDAFRGIATGFVADALGREGAIDHRIRPVWDGPAFVGTALPVATTARDNLAPYAALRFSKPGDVMMIATGDFETASVTGDIMIGMMRNAGIVAAVTDGLARDVEGIIEVGIPIYARGLSPNSPFKHGPGQIGLPVTIGGGVVEAGDIVLGDRNGVVVVPSRRIDEAIAALAEVVAKERDMDALVRSGATAPAWLDKRLAASDIHFLD
jgi:4-hydroxy-4-methyl-2-oxoglutarate aldolase